MVRDLFLNVMTTFVFIYACHLFLILRTEKKVQVISYFILLLIICLLAILEVPNLNVISAILISLVILAFYKEPLLVKGSFIIVFYVCNAICELLSIKFYSVIFMQEVFDTIYGFYSVFATSNGLMVLVIYLFSQLFSKIKILEIRKHVWLFLLLPTMTLLLILGVNDYYFVVGNTRIFMILLLGLLFANIGIGVVFHHSIQKILREKEVMHQNEIMKYELKQQKIFLHDIRNHANEMLKLLKAEQYEQLDHYIQEIYVDTLQQYNLIHSNFEIVDALINDRLDILKNNEIYVRVVLESTSFSTCTTLELGNLFHYLIDIGIHECLISHLDHKHLFIRSKEHGQQVILSFAFTSLHKVDESDLDKQLHDFIERYHLICFSDYDETNQECIIGIIF